jgi:hypothetical protein
MYPDPDLAAIKLARLNTFCTDAQILTPYCHIQKRFCATTYLLSEVYFARLQKKKRLTFRKEKEDM